MNSKFSQILFFISLIAIITFPFISLATEYTYDSLNRLVQVRYDDGTTVKYTYDAMGNRLTQTELLRFTMA